MYIWPPLSKLYMRSLYARTRIAPVCARASSSPKDPPAVYIRNNAILV